MITPSKGFMRSLAAVSALAIAATTGGAAVGQSVSDRLLEGVRVNEVDNCAVVRLDLNFSAQYQSHFPLLSGRELHIQINPIAVGAADFDALRGREELRAPSSDLAAIREIQYEADTPSGPMINLTFRHEVHFDVGQGDDFRSIVVAISGEEPNAACRHDIEPPTASGAPAARALTDEERQAAADAILSVTRVVPDHLDANAVYAVNLSSELAQTSPTLAPGLAVFEEHVAYTVNYEEDGVAWRRLRLGFFGTRTEAQQVADQLASYYPDAWIARTDRSERDWIYQGWLGAREVLAGGAPSRVAPSLEVDPVSAERLASGREALTAGDLDTAIRMFTSVVQRPESASSPEAQELLGLARERNGQLAHAKAEYETYLAKYPDGEGATRVTQRLRALLGVEDAGGVSDAERRERSITHELVGSLSLLYLRDESVSTFEDVVFGQVSESQINLNEVVAGIDVSGQIGTDRSSAKVRVSATRTQDLRDIDPQHETAVSVAYLELSDSEWETSLRIGRQSRNTGGVLGRFDGVLASAQVSPHVRANVVAGYPVLRTRDEVQTDRVFWGASVDLGTFFDRLDTTLYYVDQSDGDIVDRRAVGFEFRYFDDMRSLFGLFDYDVFYDEMNLALLNGTWRFPDQTSINLALDYRRAPLLSSYNAIQGILPDTCQMYDPSAPLIDTASDLLCHYTEDQIYGFAADRTTFSRSATIGVSRPLTDKLQVNFDATVGNVSGTETSVDDRTVPPTIVVPETPGTGTEYYYSAQLIGSNFFKDGDISIATVRYADLNTSTRYTFDLNHRHPFTRDFRVNPRLRFDYRENKNDPNTQIAGRFSTRFTYFGGSLLQFEADVGGEWLQDDINGMTNETTGYFVNLGYRLDF